MSLWENFSTDTIVEKTLYEKLVTNLYLDQIINNVFWYVDNVLMLREWCYNRS